MLCVLLEIFNRCKWIHLVYVSLTDRTDVCIVIAVNDYQLDYVSFSLVTPADLVYAEIKNEAAKKTYAFAKQGSMRYMGKDAGVAGQMKKSWAKIRAKDELRAQVERDDEEQEKKHREADPVGYALHNDRHHRLVKSQRASITLESYDMAS